MAIGGAANRARSREWLRREVKKTILWSRFSRFWLDRHFLLG